ncbi:MAG: bifunctional metallophosphatase/5'-nucleotidase [Erysipelotrichaceae bacterium]|nr:bifunctional metallophosphatase/5'-nucleotidase [Erysipelotrichaceae bacterium]
MKKIISLLVIILILLTGCQKQEAKQSEDIYIVFTSDVHCGVDENFTFASLKAYVNELESKHNDVLLVDCGDFLQGGTLGSLSKGEYVIELMNEMGYDLVTYGNHEFDYGMEQLSKLIKEMDFETVASNVAYTGTKENVFKDVPEYIIKEINGIKIGFIGILTPQSLTSSTPVFFKENDEFVYDFYSKNEGRDLFEKVQGVVDEVRKQGAKYVIALSHLGSDDKSGPYNSIALVANTAGIDVILDGHSHSIIVENKYPNKNGEDVILSSVGTKLEEVGTLIIDTEGNMTTLHMAEYANKDQEMENEVAAVYARINDILTQPLGTNEYPLYVNDDEGIRMVRSRETNCGDFVADAYRYVMGTQIAAINSGGVRANVPEGVITYNDLFAITPFQNHVASVYATGQQILDDLEVGCRKTEKLYKFDGNAVGENGGFRQVSGLRFTIDTSIESAVIMDENNIFAGFSSDARRIKDVYVLEGDEYVPLEKDKIYTVASTDYVLFGSGDGNSIYSTSEPIVASGMSDVEALKQYFSEVGIGEQYKTIQDRIIIK